MVARQKKEKKKLSIEQTRANSLRKVWQQLKHGTARIKVNFSIHCTRRRILLLKWQAGGSTHTHQTDRNNQRALHFREKLPSESKSEWAKKAKEKNYELNLLCTHAFTHSLLNGMNNTVARWKMFHCRKFIYICLYRCDWVWLFRGAWKLFVH